jgi:4-carboxymuconolactone decarboxylase
MKKGRSLIYLFFAIFYTQAIAQETTIFKKGKKAPNVHHSGDVWLNHLKDADSSFNYNVVLATFAPNAILDWHLHPGGQQLLITDGVGYYQEREKTVQIVTKGDVISCLPNVEHWHASTPDNRFAYIAITENKPTKWLEKVSSETYTNIQTPDKVATDAKQEIIEISKKKWQWMSEKKVDVLGKLFHENAVFVHMGGSWGKEQELNIIKSGGIWYKKADIQEASVQVIDDTAILLNKITLLAVVGGNEVTNPFEVTEVYVKQNEEWKLTSLSFTKLLHP